MDRDSHAIRSQLKVLCEAHPRAPKYVLVPRTQIGRALEDRLARDAEGWGGVNALVPRHYAQEVARSTILASGRRELPVAGRSFLVAGLLRELRGDEALENVRGHHHLADTVGEAIETLRRGGAAVEDVKTWANSPNASETFGLVAACYEGYLQALEENNLYDDALVFRWATERIRASGAPEVRDSIIAICDAVDLPERVHQFVKAARSECAAFYRLGGGESVDAPEQTAAALFSDANIPQVDGAQGLRGTTQTHRAVGATNEVKAAIRHILTAEAPLDEVEIAFAGEMPYLSIISDQAKETGVPVSIGTGVRASMSRTGTALLSFYEWIREDFAAEILIRMLRSGHLRVDRIRPEIEQSLGPVDLARHELATLLAGFRYESGRSGYAKVLGRAIERTKDRVDELDGKGLDASTEAQRHRHLRYAQRVVQALLELVPREASIQQMATNSRTFIERFGPVDKPPDEKPEDERTLDEAARTVLWERLDSLTQLPFEHEDRGRRLAILFERWLDGQYVRAEHPRPGTAHVVPLASAGYTGRSHLYVVGMDSDTLSTSAVEDSMLRDVDRRALSEALEGVLLESSDLPTKMSWSNRQALARHDGPLSLYSRTYDVESGEDRYPSPLFLRLEPDASPQKDLAGDTDGAPQPVGFLPDPDSVSLSDADGWLAVYRSDSSASNTDQTARSELEDRHPWVLRGEDARRARASEDYTIHDGLLDGAEDASVDFLSDDYEGPPMSASRLETFAETPYIYFLRYVLGVEPLEEPALDDEPWLNAQRRGSILHDTFESFMRALGTRGERPTPEHGALLRKTLKTQLDREMEKVTPPSTVVEEAAFRQLLADARVFLQAETEYCETHEPIRHEVGFGYGPYRRREGDFGSVSLTIGDRIVPLRGRIDRVDRGPDGRLVIWDYKTGSTSSFDEEDPLKEGAQMQWALYAYAMEHLADDPVEASGYFFTSADALGERLAFSPREHRARVEEYLTRLSRLARTGSFPMSERARYLNAWKYRGYDRVFLDLAKRSGELKEKTYPDDRPIPLCDV